MQPRLTVSDLACRRGDRLLFAGLSFALAASDALHVIGENGIGKSSLLRILAGLLRPFAGAVDRAGAVALLDDRLPLDPHLPLGRALGFWSGLGRANEVLHWPEVTASSDVPVRFLSTGQRKRAGIVQSAPHSRGIGLLNEPLNGLDAAGVAALLARIEAYRADGGIAVIASHQPIALDELRRIDLAEFAA